MRVKPPSVSHASGRTVLSVSLAACLISAAACGGAPAMSPATPSTPTADGASGGGGSGAAEAPPPPKMSGEIRRFEKAATHLKVDKIGAEDGSYSPDGTMDCVYELDVDGPADGVLFASTDARGEPNGELAADTFTGTDPLPEAVASLGGFGKHTLGVGVYADGKLANAPDGHLPALAPGKHGLTIHLSPKSPPKTGALRVYVRFTDGSVVKGPTVQFP